MDIREVFEAWVASNGRNIEHFSDGSYKSMTLDKEWEAWQAATAQCQADTKRIDFLADKSQSVANVMLPTEIVERNLSSLRDAIDETMMIDGMRYDVTNSISGEDAKLAWAKGQQVQVRPKTPSGTWGDLSGRHSLDIFGQGDSYEFRLKPRTILINGIEVPCCGQGYRYGDAMYILNGLDPSGYIMIVLDEIDDVPLYGWRTEDEIKQVVAALRQVFVVGPIIEI